MNRKLLSLLTANAVQVISTLNPQPAATAIPDAAEVQAETPAAEPTAVPPME